jgi:hypothetical protein
MIRQSDPPMLVLVSESSTPEPQCSPPNCDPPAPPALPGGDHGARVHMASTQSTPPVHWYPDRTTRPWQAEMADGVDCRLQ